MSDSRGSIPPKGAVAVIFIAQRTHADEEGYSRAAARMDELVAQSPGFLGYDSTRGSDGLGITVSYWADRESALAWRANAEHAAVRELGRELWYAHYRLIVAEVERSYRWVAGN